MELVSQGRRAQIFRTKEHGKDIAYKRALAPQHRDAIRKEAQILERLQVLQAWFVPVLLHTQDDQFAYQRIVGEAWKTQFPKGTPTQQQFYAQQLLDIAYQLDSRGIVHGELDRPTNNILIDANDKVWLIDFERGWRGDSSGKNMRHLAQRRHRTYQFPLEHVRALAQLPLAEVYSTLSAYLSSL